MGKALAPGPLQRLAQLRGLFGEHRNHLVQVTVSGGLRDAVITGQRVRGGTVAEPAHAQHACQKQVSALLPFGVPRCRRSWASSFATNCTSSLGTSTVAR